jgi:hypothetical protein
MSGIIMGNIRGIGDIVVTVDPANVAANSTSEQTFSVPGLLPGDKVYAHKATYDAGLAVVNARVSAQDTLALTFMNCTGAGIDAPSQLITLMIFRPEVLGNTQFPAL